MNYLNLKLTRDMTFRILLLIIFCSSVFISEASCQWTIENFKRINSINPLKINGNIKHVSLKRYSRLERKMNFNLSLFDYNQKHNFANEEYFYDSIGSLVRHEYKSSFVHRNTNEIKEGHSMTEWKHHENQIIKIKSNKDSIYSTNKLTLFYDDKDRIVKVKKILTPTSDYSIEEIEYFAEGKKSILYSIKDSIKSFLSEILYDEDGNLLSMEWKHNHRNNIERYDYYYNENGTIDVSVRRSLNTNVLESFSGSYIQYIYNKYGILKKTKEYNLVGEYIGDLAEYNKGRLRSASRYKERKKGEYILQFKRTKSVGEKAKKRARVILDKNRSIVLRYNPPSRHSDGSIRKGDLTIYNISYY